MTRPYASDQIAEAFERFAPNQRAGLVTLRAMIFEIAAELPEIGPVEEVLRWGQPAYLTPSTGAATTLRLGVPKGGGFALFVHCRTRLIADFKAAFPGRDRIDGTRGVLFDDPAQIDRNRHGFLIRSALTYHL
jgi:hypothetical protein